MHKIYKNLSFAYGAQKLIIGADEIVSKIQANKIKLVLMSSNASLNTQKKIQNKCDYYKVKLIIINDIENHLDYIFKGKSIKVMGLSDSNFIKMITKNIKE